MANTTKKEYSFIEITEEIKNNAVLLRAARINNAHFAKQEFEKLSPEEQEAKRAELEALKEAAKAEKRFENQIDHNLCLRFDDEKTTDSLLSLSIKRYFSEKFGYIAIITNATAVSTKINYIVMGASNKENATLVVKDLLKGKNNKFTRSAATRLTHNGNIQFEDGTEEKYTGSNERVHNLVKGLNAQMFNEMLDKFETLSGKAKYPVTNIADMDEKSAAYKNLMKAIAVAKN